MEERESRHCVSTSGGAIVSFDNIEELLQCPVCYDFMCCPIYQCRNGHTICLSCKPRVENKCPSCRVEMDDIRCLTLEKIVESVELRCKYEEYGCLESIRAYCNKLKHEESCKFRPYNCPRTILGCSAIGDISTLVSHLTNHHKANIINDSNFQRGFRIAHLRHDQSSTWMVNVSHCFGQYFCLHVEATSLRKAPVYMAFIYFMGNDMEACKYRHRLEIEGNGRKFIFEGIPRSLREDRTRIIDKGDALIVMRSLPHFLEEETRTRRLQIAVQIWKYSHVAMTHCFYFSKPE